MHTALLDTIQLYCAFFVQKDPMLNKFLSIYCDRSLCLKSNYYWITKKKNLYDNNKTLKQISIFLQNL